MIKNDNISGLLLKLVKLDENDPKKQEIWKELKIILRREYAKSQRELGLEDDLDYDNK